MTKIFSKKITLALKLRNRSQNSFLRLRLLKIILAPPALAPQYWFIVYSSVAEPPLFWDAPAPDGQGPGADSGSGSDLLGSAPAPSKKRRLRLFILKFFILSFQKVNYILIKVYFGPYLPVSARISEHLLNSSPIRQSVCTLSFSPKLSGLRRL